MKNCQRPPPPSGMELPQSAMDMMDIEHEVMHSGIPQLLERLRTPQSQRRQRRHEKFEFTHWNDFEQCWSKLHGEAYNGQNDERPRYNVPASFEGSDLATWLSLQNQSRPQPHVSTEGLDGTSPPRARSPPRDGSRPSSPGSPNSPDGAFTHEEQPLLPPEAFRIGGGRWRSDYNATEPRAVICTNGLGPVIERAAPAPASPNRALMAEICQTPTTPLLQPAVDVTKRVKPSFAMRVGRHAGTQNEQQKAALAFAQKEQHWVEQQRARGVQPPVPHSSPSLNRSGRPDSRRSLSMGIPLPSQGSKWGNGAPARGLLRKQPARSKSQASRVPRKRGVPAVVRSGSSSGCHVQTHHLDFGESTANFGHKKKLGAGSRIQGGVPAQTSLEALTINRSKSSQDDEEEVYVVQYQGDRPATREIDRILKRVVAPPSMLSPDVRTNKGTPSGIDPWAQADRVDSLARRLSESNI